MPNYTLGEIMSFATGNAGRRADLDSSIVSRLANEAYFEVYYASDPQESEKIAVSSTTTGESRVELPNDFREPLTATLIYMQSWSTNSSQHSSHQSLKVVSVGEMDSKNDQPSGVPREIAFYNSWAELYPSPNSAYSFQLRYRNHPADLVATTDVPSLSTPWRSAVVKKTEENIFRYLNDEVASQNAQIRYLDYVTRLKSDMATRQGYLGRFGVAPSWGKGGRRRV